MILFPPAKINLGLKVLNKREDAYHALETIMYQIPFYDILEIIKAPNFEFKATGLAISGNENDNLCVKAYQILHKLYSISPVKIHLHKVIPMGAGLGGGSADGTYTLLLLNDLFELNLSKDELRHLALNLGSDCPLFVDSFPQLAAGRGEILSEINIDLKGKYMYIVNIGIHVSTKMAFENLNFEKCTSNFELKDLNKTPLEKWRNVLINDFEVSVFKKYPELEDLKEELYDNGAIYSSMTGSGSTLFAIFNQKPELVLKNNSEKVIEKLIYIE